VLVEYRPQRLEVACGIIVTFLNVNTGRHEYGDNAKIQK
jgi:hypothetical protein